MEERDHIDVRQPLRAQPVRWLPSEAASADVPGAPLGQVVGQANINHALLVFATCAPSALTDATDTTAHTDHQSASARS